MINLDNIKIFDQRCQIKYNFFILLNKIIYIVDFVRQKGNFQVLEIKIELKIRRENM